MILLLRNTACIMVGLVALPDVAAAQNLAEAASKWGLIGTWALDCGKPAGGSNGHLTFAIRRAGQVSYERDFGDRQDVNEVREVRTGAGGALEVVVHYPKLEQTRRLTFIMGTDGRTRTMANSNVDGTQLSIKDGKFTQGGSDTPWQVRCR